MSAYALPSAYFCPTTPPEKSPKEVKSLNATTNTSIAHGADETTSSKTIEDEKQDTETWYNPSELFISIQSGSIDPIRLIQGITTFKSQSSSIKSTSSGADNDKGSIRIECLSNSFAERMNVSHADGECWGEYSEEFEEVDVPICNDAAQDDVTDFHTSPPRAKHDHDAHSTSAQPTVSTTEDSHDDAIQFTLSISFNGRKYTATRALQSFIKLRNDLISEFSNHKRRHCKSRLHQSPECKDNNGEDDDSISNDVRIPEVPIAGDSRDGNKLVNGPMAMVGHGFTGLQATICSYCPPMEHWIQKIAKLVPSSPALAKFLWEPIQNNNQEAVPAEPQRNSKSNCAGGQRALKRRESHFSSRTTLGAINESESMDSDDSDSEDAW